MEVSNSRKGAIIDINEGLCMVSMDDDRTVDFFPDSELYIFEKDSHRPVFYRVAQSSIVDKTAFVDTLKTAGCKDCIIIADKGFYSRKNLSALMNAGLKFILPLQANTSNVADEFYEDKDDHKFDNVFTYNKRTVWYTKKPSGIKGSFIYTFRDDIRRTGLQERFVEMAENDYGEENYSPMDVLCETRMGYFSFCSNLDIEQCFDYLKNSVSGWAFLNPISLIYFYGLLNAMRDTRLDEKYTAEDILKLAKNIYMIDIGDGQGCKVSAIQKKTGKLLECLGVDLLRNF